MHRLAIIHLLPMRDQGHLERREVLTVATRYLSKLTLRIAETAYRKISSNCFSQNLVKQQFILFHWLADCNRLATDILQFLSDVETRTEHGKIICG